MALTDAVLTFQNGKDPEFKCKFSDDCFVGVKNRRRCQRCRYNRCLKAGMNPDAVLTDEQKLIRFRDRYHKTFFCRQKLLSSSF